jgi:flagellum-specific peptidoglycan hydrolase FlgJ
MKKLIIILSLALAPSIVQNRGQKQVKFLPSIKPTTLTQYIKHCANKYNIPEEVIFHVGWNESHLGQSPLALRSNNCFGIKAYDWNGDTCGKWRKYDSKFASVDDFCKFIVKHYPQMIGRPLEGWTLKGYKSKPYKF